MALGEREPRPDMLIMSATPIPRSTAMAVYGDLDLSVLDQLPPGRKPVQTLLKRPDARDDVYRFVDKELEAGRQAYVVYPLVEESEKVDLKAATEEYERLVESVFSHRRVRLIHGQLPSEEKDRVMRDFAAGEVDVLVATTVIEVGIDVANASVMVVENAERFGLSQLHQLRGRVGRYRQAKHRKHAAGFDHAIPPAGLQGLLDRAQEQHPAKREPVAGGFGAGEVLGDLAFHGGDVGQAVDPEVLLRSSSGSDSNRDKSDRDPNPTSAFGLHVTPRDSGARRVRSQSRQSARRRGEARRGEEGGRGPLRYGTALRAVRDFPLAVGFRFS